MPDVLPTIPQEPAQGIQAQLDLVYLFNADATNEVIEKCNELLARLGDTSGVRPYEDLVAPVEQYTATTHGTGLYVANERMETLPEQFDDTKWTLIATKVDAAAIEREIASITVQYSTMPEATAANEGQIVQYTGTTGAYTNGWFYKCVSDGQNPATYSWQYITATDLSGYLPLTGGTVRGAILLHDPGVPQENQNVSLHQNWITRGLNITTPETIYAIDQYGIWSSSAPNRSLGLRGSPWQTVYTKAISNANTAENMSILVPHIPGRLGVQLTTMPAAAEEYLGHIYEYVGDTTQDYTKGYFYQCVSDGAAEPTYSWLCVRVQPTDSAYMTYPASWPTSSSYTTKQFCDAIAEDASAVAGNAYLGEVRLNDLPGGIVNSEVEVKIMYGSSAQTKIIVLTLTSGNVAPYLWQYTYWNHGSSVSGWVGFVSTNMVVDNYNSSSATAPLSANMGRDLNERVTAVEGRGRYLSTWDCTTGLAGTNPPVSPYEYKAGDYFVVGVVGATNYKPTGSQYVIGTASTVVETGTVNVNDTYQYDGTNWTLLRNTVDDPLPAQAGNAGKFLTTNGTTPSWADVDAFPTQTGNAGKFLTTDGSAVSWGEALVNKAEYFTTTSVAIGPTTGVNGAREYSVNIGYNSYGTGTNAGGSVGIGANARTGGLRSIAIGHGTETRYDAPYAIQIGSLAGNSVAQNSNANTLKIANGVANYELMSADGTIPADRLAHAINKYDTLPAAAAANEGWLVQYTGADDAVAGLTHGYIYESTQFEATATGEQTYGSGLSDITVTNISTFEATFCSAFSVSAMSGTTVVDFEYDGSAWMVSAEIEGQTESVFDQNIADWAVTFTGTPQMGDTITVTHTAGGYTWVRTDVQPAPVIPDPLPSQTGNAGKFLTTDGTDASWANALTNKATGNEALAIEGLASGTRSVAVSGVAYCGETVAIGVYATAYGNVGAGNNVLIGKDTQMMRAANCVAIGRGARVSSSATTLTKHAIQLGSTGSYTYNDDSNTFKVANENGNYEIMSADGTVPTDRFTTTPVADGTYVPTLSISSGTATRTWAAPATGIPSQTGHAGEFLTTDGTDASWAAPVVATFRVWGANE